MSDKIIAVRKAGDRAKPAATPPNAETTPAPNPEPVKPAPAGEGEISTSPPTFPQRPFTPRPRRVERPEIKPLVELPQAENASGEVFSVGDQISVRSPWGGHATAEIVKFYQDDAGCAWASYIPRETRQDFTWEKGCIRAALLQKA